MPNNTGSLVQSDTLWSYGESLRTSNTKFIMLDNGVMLAVAVKEGAKTYALSTYFSLDNGETWLVGYSRIMPPTNGIIDKTKITDVAIETDGVNVYLAWLYRENTLSESRASISSFRVGLDAKQPYLYPIGSSVDVGLGMVNIPDFSFAVSPNGLKLAFAYIGFGADRGSDSKANAYVEEFQIDRGRINQTRLQNVKLTNYPNANNSSDAVRKIAVCFDTNNTLIVAVERYLGTAYTFSSDVTIFKKEGLTNAANTLFNWTYLSSVKSATGRIPYLRLHCSRYGAIVLALIMPNAADKDYAVALYSANNGVSWSNVGSGGDISSNGTAYITRSIQIADIASGDICFVMDMYDSNSGGTYRLYTRRWTFVNNTITNLVQLNASPFGYDLKAPQLLKSSRVLFYDSQKPPIWYKHSNRGLEFMGVFDGQCITSTSYLSLYDKSSPVSILSYAFPKPKNYQNTLLNITKIEEKVNGVTIRTINNPVASGSTYSGVVDIPSNIWDTLEYYKTHTIEIHTTVNGSSNSPSITRFTFRKTAPNDASLLEATKANSDFSVSLVTKVSDLIETATKNIGYAPAKKIDGMESVLIDTFSGKRWASGTITASDTLLNFDNMGNSNQRGSITVSGLSFKPAIIIAVGGNVKIIYAKRDYFQYADGDLPEVQVYQGKSTIGNFENYNVSGNAYVTNGGFCLPALVNVTKTYSYIAIEG